MVTSYYDFMKKMRSEWDCKYDDNFLLHQLYDVKKKNNEDIQEFIIIFNKIIEKILDDIIPLEKKITLHFMNSFDTSFSFLLKENNPPSFDASMEMACYMQRQVSSSSHSKILIPSISHRSSQPKKDDKASGSMKFDPTLNLMQSILRSINEIMKQKYTMLQMMQEDRSHPKPSYDQSRKINNNEGRRNFNQIPNISLPKQSNVVNDENINIEEEECSYSHNQEEEEEDPSVDDNVHVITEEDTDAIFVADEDQMFTVFKDDFPKKIAHSISYLKIKWLSNIRTCFN